VVHSKKVTYKIPSYLKIQSNLAIYIAFMTFPHCTYEMKMVKKILDIQMTLIKV